MILLFDVGNTNIVLGFVEGNKIVKNYRFITNSNLTEDEYYNKIHLVLKNEKIEGVAISSVVPKIDHMLRLMCEKYFHLLPFFVGPGVRSSIKIKIENPKQLGADLLCDAVGAYNYYQGPSIIIDLGTVSKFIVVSENKEFLGGAISPGIMTSLTTMISSAAKLSEININKPNSVIGNDTQSCIQSGIIFGFSSMIDGMIAKIKKELNTDNIKVFLTGGLAPTIKDYLNTDFEYTPNILLEGLLTIYNKNN